MLILKFIHLHRKVIYYLSLVHRPMPTFVDIYLYIPGKHINVCKLVIVKLNDRCELCTINLKLYSAVIRVMICKYKSSERA